MSENIRFCQLREELRQKPATWLVTGVAGFIGSNLLEHLLRLNQNVVGLDNFSTGHWRNLDDVKSLVSAEQWARFNFIEGDICQPQICRTACEGVDFVLHQAALGSVPRSLEDPLRSHAPNVNGFLNMLVAARDAKVARMVYASSSSVYGDHPALPKEEAYIGRPLSPYAATKLIDEIYADVFARCYRLPLIGLRYFNVFGPRQDPNGAYAAVIPRWFAALLGGDTVTINGDGETSRDFCYIENVIQANLLAATATNERDFHTVFNIACGARTTLRELFQQIRAQVLQVTPEVANYQPRFASERSGDVKHSLANIRLANMRLGYAPTHTLETGLVAAASWYAKNTKPLGEK